MNLDQILLALRNDLVSFWTQLVLANGHEALIDGYTQYAEALDNLDPDSPHHMDTIENAITCYRMAVTDLSCSVLANKGGDLTPNQLVLKRMKREPISLEDERRLEAFHGC